MVQLPFGDSAIYSTFQVEVKVTHVLLHSRESLTRLLMVIVATFWSTTYCTSLQRHKTHNNIISDNIMKMFIIQNP